MTLEGRDSEGVNFHYAAMPQNEEQGEGTQAVDDRSIHHLIIAHEVSNVGNDRWQLSNKANQKCEEIEAGPVVDDRGY